MRTLLAAGLALLSSFACAKSFQGQGDLWIKRWAPLWEETLKSLFSWLLTGSLWGVHVLFGFGEAFYEWRQHKSSSLFLVNILSHGFFGGIAMVLLPTGRWVSWSVSMAVHFIWNNLILLMANKKNF